MKVDRRRTPLALLLLAAVVSCEVGAAQEVRLVRKDPIAAADAGNDARGGPIGTEHAPVDGKDGMPHEGPWIETATDRQNQKLKDSDEEEAVYTSGDAAPVNAMPQSNDGVMDDPNRKAPQEGTRGTDGGVSQRTKGGKTRQREPEQPKEAPPLPHSEKERIDMANEDRKEDLLGETEGNVEKPKNFEVSLAETSG